MAIAPNILVIDDDPAIREACLAVLEGDGYRVHCANQGEAGFKVINEENIDLVLLDLKMPGMDGLEVLERLKQDDPELLVIIVTGYGTIESAVKAIRLGALDFITKPFSPDELRMVVGRGLSIVRLARQNRLLREELNRSCDSGDGTDSLVGESEAIERIRELIRKVGPTDSTVLILGETGTGKEMVSRAIHRCSERREMPMLIVDCGSLVESLFESELFGHVKGSFTGAVNMKHGRFELANGGTLFFDEVGNLGPQIQAKLLRALQEKEIVRVGGTHPIKVDVRIIAATNKDIVSEVRNGSFREDLFYRLSVVPVILPPLRQRKSDIPLLVQHFLKKHGQRRRKNIQSIAPKAMNALMGYSWPGNVRELESVIERAAVLTENDVLQPEDLMFFGQSDKPGLLPPDRSLRTLDEVEEEHIQEMLQAANGNISRAAEILGIDRKTLRFRMDKIKLKTTGVG